jgi:hypothetical protein
MSVFGFIYRVRFFSHNPGIISVAIQEILQIR